MVEIIDDDGELKPHCPACCRLLDGPLVASSCNHVFHRACLPADDAPCPKCQKPCERASALELFGLGFGNTNQNGVSVQQLPAGAREAAAEVCSLAREVEQTKRVTENLHQRLEDAKTQTAKQQAKKKQAEKDRLTIAEKCEKVCTDLEREKVKRTTLLDQVDRNREQS